MYWPTAYGARIGIRNVNEQRRKEQPLALPGSAKY